jgi:hypothetical protein
MVANVSLKRRLQLLKFTLDYKIYNINGRTNGGDEECV